MQERCRQTQFIILTDLRVTDIILWVMRQLPVDNGQPRSEDHKEGVDTHEQVTVLEVRVELHKEKVRGDFTGASECH